MSYFSVIYVGENIKVIDVQQQRITPSSLNYKQKKKKTN